MVNGKPQRVALVTGGAQGIGLGITKTFIEAGYCVLMVDKDDEAGKEAMASFSGHCVDDSSQARFLQANVVQEDEVKRIEAFVRERFGRLDVLVNNAGIGGTKTIRERSMDEWDDVLAVNLRAPYMMTKYLVPYLEQSDPGVIINIASTRALMSEANTEPYSASKGGLLALTHSLAVSLGPKVRVNAISPGWIEVGDWRKKADRLPIHHSKRDMEQHPAGRVGGPIDIGNMALYLASPQASFITGQNFVVDGGMTIKMIYEE